MEEAGRTALWEMRRLLDAMRRDGDEIELAPPPGLRDVNLLLDDVRAAGLDVRLRIKGDPVDLPPGLDLSAYRIVQEALMNTLKHGDTTVKTHVTRVLQKLQVRDRAQAIVLAYQCGLFPSDQVLDRRGGADGRSGA